MRISQIYIRVNVHEWEKKEQIENSINILLKDIDKKKITIKYSEDKGLVSNKIGIYEIRINKKEVVEKFLKNLLSLGLSIEDIEKKGNFDENYNLYLRIDKNDLIIKNKVSIFYGDDTFFIKISFDGYKKSREKIIDYLRNYLQEIINKNI
ncbi:MAG: RNA-binding domain-containing protein [Nanopusillaceae archaeon]